MPSRSLASSEPIGSSISSALGRRTRARPMATRCMSPPESAEGLRPSRWPMPMAWATLRTDLSTSSLPCPVARSGKAMFS